MWFLGCMEMVTFDNDPFVHAYKHNKVKCKLNNGKYDSDMSEQVYWDNMQLVS